MAVHRHGEPLGLSVYVSGSVGVRKYLLIFFLIFGVADMLYGLYRNDGISMVIGGVMAVIAFTLLKKEKTEKTE